MFFITGMSSLGATCKLYTNDDGIGGFTLLVTLLDE
jgi:hypothetical protein